MVKKNEVATVKKQEVAEYQAGGRGFDDVDNTDLIIPRAKLIQAMSPEMKDRDLDVKPGMIINSLTKEELPETFIPLFMFKNFIRFNAKNKDLPGFDSAYEPGAIIWRSSDHRDPKVIAETAWVGDNKPLATTFMNFLSWFPGSAMPIILSFSKTSYKAGKDLVSLAKFTGGDMFSRQYKLTSVEKTSPAGDTYNVLKVAAAGKATDEDYKFCEALWKDYAPKAKDIIVHDENETTESTDSDRPY